jgi:2-oxoisovalerate dehydrogenase E1 component
VPLPLLFVCEDNGIGISVKTPTGWIEANFSNRPGLKYFACDGLDIFDTYSNRAGGGAEFARKNRQPVFLHVKHRAPVTAMPARMCDGLPPKPRSRPRRPNDPLAAFTSALLARPASAAG